MISCPRCPNPAHALYAGPPELAPHLSQQHRIVPDRAEREAAEAKEVEVTPRGRRPVCALHRNIYRRHNVPPRTWGWPE